MLNLPRAMYVHVLLATWPHLVLRGAEGSWALWETPKDNVLGLMGTPKDNVLVTLDLQLIRWVNPGGGVVGVWGLNTGFFARGRGNFIELY